MAPFHVLLLNRAFQCFSSSIPKHLVSRLCTAQEGNKLSSYLCVPPSQSQKQVAILTPYFSHLDFSPEGNRLMRSNLEHRKMSTEDLEDLAKDWNKRRELRVELENVERERSAILQEIRLKRNQGLTEESIAELIESGQRIKGKAKAVAQSLHTLEEKLMPRILSLPNDIHPATPLTGESEPASNRDWDCGAEISASHAGLGPYYSGQEAIAELAAMDLFDDHFVQNSFEPFSGPDFCKPVVIEGCGHAFNDPYETFHLTPADDSGQTEFHLTGSATLPSFCAYFTKCSVPNTMLPLKYYAVGRGYTPPTNHSRLDSAQSSRLHFFVASRSQSEEDAAFSSCVGMLASAYEMLGISCQLVDSTAAELSAAESRRVELRMRSLSSQANRTLASVTSCNDFISKRLWMCHHDSIKHTSGFLHVVHGMAISFPILLECIAENRLVANYGTQFPETLLTYMNNYR